jgi:hypothetical protein
MPSQYMDYETLASYINDEVLFYIYEENEESMLLDWRQLFICKNDDQYNDNNLDFF